MYDAVVEINDIDLPIWVADRVSQTPAYALLQDGGLVFGTMAQAQARLHPLLINSRFIQQLSLVETPELHPYARHHADLAYRFLQYAHADAGSPDRCVFVVPPSYTAEHMSVLLGVVKPCDFDAVGLVDQAVAAASTVATGNGVFCDLHLHQLVLGAFMIEDGQVVRTESQSIERLGLLSLHEKWVRIIAEAFIQQCRYNPLHDAAVEQQLWSEFPASIAQQQEADLFEFQLLNKHQVKIHRADLLAPVVALQTQLLERVARLKRPVEQILLSHRLAGLPGLTLNDSRLLTLSANQVTQAIAVQQQRICSNTETLPFITRLPLLEQGAVTGQRGPGVVPSAKSAGLRKGSHFLLDNTAHDLAAGPIYLNCLGSAIVWSRNSGAAAVAVLRTAETGWELARLDNHPAWVNGEALAEVSCRLSRGDYVQLAEEGAELRLISVAGTGDET